MIKKLYQASSAGVRVKLIVRGTCSLIPNKKGLSDKISAISIVDRFLEHSRIYVFCNGGDEKYYISSADWMTRNLDKRIELLFPVGGDGDRSLLDLHASGTLGTGDNDFFQDRVTEILRLNGAADGYSGCGQ